MPEPKLTVEDHYGVRGILDSILEPLVALGKDPEHLDPTDLAPVDEFHIRGREATLELAARANLSAGSRVLDVGCGLGGSVRHLAVEHGCHATGLDLTAEYIEGATSLATRVGLAEAVEFVQGSALDLPFEDGTFDAVWTEHAQMNIADKATFYGEIARVLRPGGRLVFHDIFLGDGAAVRFPVPWAEEASISALADPTSIRTALEASGLHVLDWEDKTTHSREWFEETIARIRADGPPPIGIHLLMGNTALTKLENMVHALQVNAVAVVQAVAERV